MNTKFYLIVNEKGIIRTTKNEPGLTWNEVAIHLSVNLPNALFQKPLLQGEIIVDAKDVQPTVITPDI